MNQSTLQISELVQTLRKRLNLSQAKLAARLGVSFQTVNRWERGRVNPSPMAMKILEHEQMSGCRGVGRRDR
jgi:DNA-binding transcriptional regulator YiaG